METISLEIWGEWIELHQLLKVTGIAGSGGEAKGMVSGGAVEVDGVRELRKAAKVRVGQMVVVGGVRVEVKGGGEGGKQLKGKGFGG
jgi:ribosome-associated protein